MSRWAVTGLFVVGALAMTPKLAHAWSAAADVGNVSTWAVAGSWLLKIGVLIAFSVLVALRESSRRASRDPVALLACAAALTSIAALRSPTDSGPTGPVVAGDLVGLASAAWILFAVIVLGRCFGVLPEVRGLVTRGPYRLVRHPVYLGEFGACAGLVVANPHLWNIGCAAVFGAAQAVRMNLEEHALMTAFPEYRDYAARTPQLVPRLGRRRRAERGSEPVLEAATRH
jgi:protein-S-isoprenylcysteine O-methyltransferase Ste14